MAVGRGQRGRTTRSTRSRGRTPWRGTHRPRTDEPRPPRKPLGGLRRDALDVAHPLIVEADSMFDEDLRRLIPLLDAPEDEEDLVGVPHRGRQLVCAREDRRLDGAGEVLDLREHHQLLLFGDVLARARADARDRDERALLGLLELAEVRVDDVAHARGELLQRMRGQVDPEELLLPRQELLARDLAGRDVRRDERADRAERGAAEIEERDLPLPSCLLLVLRGRHDRIQTRELMLACAEPVGRAALDERLEDALVAALKVDAPAEVVERAESPAILARLDDALDRTLPDVLDRAETEADPLARDRESEVRLIHVGR